MTTPPTNDSLAKSETPRTDAQINWNVPVQTTVCFVDANFARQLERELNAAKQALEVAINTVECASIDLNTQEELPWYKMAKAVLERTNHESK
jgi:RecB family endonuclease NucS